MLETSSYAKKKGEYKNISGQKFFRLTALHVAGKDKSGRKKWLCKCDCGNEKIVLSDNLCRGVTKSCGCWNKEQKVRLNTTHGMSQMPIHSLWLKMIDRCLNPNNKAFNNYGGRGISVCERWLKFENFFEDMGNRPEGKSLERIDNQKGYSKENCCWATDTEQARNKRNNHLIEYMGHKKSIAEWAEILNIKYHTLFNRLCVYGFSIEIAMTMPVRGKLVQPVKLAAKQLELAA